MAYAQKSLIGGLTSLLSLPCATPPMVWATSAVDASLRLFYAYEQPDFKHLIHIISGRTLLCGARQLGQGMYEGTLIAGSSADEWMWLLAEAAEWFSFSFFIAAIGVHGLIDWTTAVIRETKAACHPSQYYGSGDEPVIGGVADGQYECCAVWRGPNWPTNPGGGGSALVGAGWAGGVGGGCIFTDLVGDPLGGGLRIVDTRTGIVMDESSMYTKQKNTLGPYRVYAEDRTGVGPGGLLELQCMAYEGGVLPRYMGWGGSGYWFNYHI